MGINHTKNRILDEAEKLFAENGIGHTSLRAIVATAEVNLAAVHYHFGSKLELILAVYKRHLDPINQERMQNLDAVEAAAAGEAPDIETILQAFIMPILNIERHHPKKHQQIMWLFSRMQAEPQALRQQILGEFHPILKRFISAIRRALPALKGHEVALRFQFMLGAMFIALLSPPEYRELIKVEGRSPEPQTKVDHLIAFLAAGFKSAPPGRLLEGEHS